MATDNDNNNNDDDDDDDGVDDDGDADDDDDDDDDDRDMAIAQVRTAATARPLNLTTRQNDHELKRSRDRVDVRAVRGSHADRCGGCRTGGSMTRPRKKAPVFRGSASMHHSSLLTGTSHLNSAGVGGENDDKEHYGLDHACCRGPWHNAR